jgi:hypothetical protein
MLKAHHLENNVSFGLFLIKANHDKEKKLQACLHTTSMIGVYIFYRFRNIAS